MKGKILLHACCGPCATSSIERLIEDDWEIIVFFSNSNIYPESEYSLRLENLVKTSEHFGLKWLADEYRHERWLVGVSGFEDEPEKGRRCSVCFGFSFERASLTARELGCEGFTSSLTVSPHKNSRVIFETGRNYGNYIEYDFKKKDGFRRSIELSERLGLYRQPYCGCEFSFRPAVRRDT